MSDRAPLAPPVRLCAALTPAFARPHHAHARPLQACLLLLPLRVLLLMVVAARHL